LEAMKNKAAVQVTYSSFYDMIRRLSVVVDEARFILEGDKLYVRTMDPSQIAMIYEQVYAFRSGAEQKDGYFDLNVSSVFKLLDRPSKATAGQVVLLNFEGLENKKPSKPHPQPSDSQAPEHPGAWVLENATKIEILVPGGAVLKLPLLDGENGSPKEPNFEWGMELGVAKTELVNCLKKCNAVSTHVTFNVDFTGSEKCLGGEVVQILARGDNGDVVIPFKTQDNDVLEKKARVVFPIEFVLGILKEFPLGVVRVSLRSDAPLKLTAKSGQLRYYLAPRVETI